MVDAPLANGGDGWLIDRTGLGFTVSTFDADAPPLTLPVTGLLITRGDVRPAPKGWTVLRDLESIAHKRYDAQPGSTYLARLHRYVAWCWRSFATQSIEAALKRGTGHG